MQYFEIHISVFVHFQACENPVNALDKAAIKNKGDWSILGVYVEDIFKAAIEFKIWCVVDH